MEREATSPTHGSVAIVALTSIAPAVATGRGLPASHWRRCSPSLLVVVALFSWHDRGTLRPVEEDAPECRGDHGERYSDA